MSDIAPAPSEGRTPVDPAGLRVSYAAGLLEGACAPTPLAQFEQWFAQAVAAPLPEPNAMVLATAAVRTGADGAPVAEPSSRTVLLKGVDLRGFTFFTNLGSRKGRELTANPWASLTFPWFPMARQVGVVGRVEQVTREESAAYFRSRPYGSRLGAWASEQSAVIASREVLKARYAELAAAFPDTGSPDDVPLPQFWGGFAVLPASVEFWAGRESRLHDRLRYVRRSPSPSLADGGAALDDEDAWELVRLSP